MANISDLSDELLVKILSFLPTKNAVSTSILSKQWEFLWMWSPNLKFDFTRGSVRDFINKNLPLHRAPIINRLRLSFRNSSLQPENFKSWIEIAVSRAVRELICVGNSYKRPFLVLPSSLYTCNSLVTLKLEGAIILVDIPGMVCLPSLKTLKLSYVTYSNEDSLRLLLSYCLVLEDLTIKPQNKDNVKALVIIIPSLQRLSLFIDESCSEDECVIVTPSLKYLEILDDREDISYLIEHMPELEEADITVMPDTDIKKLLKSITSVKRLSLWVTFNNENVAVYLDGIVFSQLKNLKLCTCGENWSEISFQVLEKSPKLQILHLDVENHSEKEYRSISWSNNHAFVPKCLLKSLKTFKFEGFRLGEEQNDFLSFIFKHAHRLKSSSISLRTGYGQSV